jgi:hypothetical protein
MSGTTVRRFTLTAAVLILAAGGPGRASANVVLTFDAQATGTYTSLTENGFQLTWVGFGDPQAVADLGGGNKALVDSNPSNVFGAEVNITPIGGGKFNLNSLEIANLDNPGGGVSQVGTGGGFRIELANDLGGIIAYSTGSSTFTPVSPSGFSNISLLSVNIVSFSPSSLTFAVDNINLSSVPEPSTLASCGIAAVALAGYRLRRRKSN